MKTKTKLGLAAGAVAAVGALGAAYYFYGAKGAKKHRKAVASWMVKAEKEIMAKAKQMKDATFNEKNYHKIVAEVSKKYEALSHIDKKDIVAFKQVLKSAWKELKKNATRAASSKKSTPKKVATKSKKTSPKVGK